MSNVLTYALLHICLAIVHNCTLLMICYSGSSVLWWLERFILPPAPPPSQQRKPPWAWPGWVPGQLSALPLPFSAVLGGQGRMQTFAASCYRSRWMHCSRCLRPRFSMRAVCRQCGWKWWRGPPSSCTLLSQGEWWVFCSGKNVRRYCWKMELKVCLRARGSEHFYVLLCSCRQPSTSKRRRKA